MEIIDNDDSWKNGIDPNILNKPILKVTQVTTQGINVPVYKNKPRVHSPSQTYQEYQDSLKKYQEYLDSLKKKEYPQPSQVPQPSEDPKPSQKPKSSKKPKVSQEMNGNFIYYLIFGIFLTFLIFLFIYLKNKK